MVTPNNSAALPSEADAAPHVANALGKVDRDLIEREILNQLVRDLTGFSQSPQTVLERLTHAARRIVLAEGTCVLEVENEMFRAVAASGTISPYDGLTFAMMPDPSLLREVIANKRPMFTNSGADPRIDARFRIPLAISHVAIAPILIDGAVNGLLLCINSGRGGFSYDDLLSLQRLADHTALALHSARLIRAADEAVTTARQKAADAAREGAHLSVLARTASTLANALTRDDLYNGLAQIIEENLGGVGCCIYDADANKRTARLEFQSGVARVNPEFAARNFWITRLGHVVDTGQPLFVTDIARNSNDPELLLNEPLRREGVGTIAALPLTIGDKTRGLLAVRFRGSRTFGEDDQRLLANFATLVAAALRHVGYFGDLELRTRRLAALAEAQQRLSRLVSRETLLPAIADAVQHVVPAATCELLFAGAGTLRVVYATLYGRAVPVEQSGAHDLELARTTHASGIPRIGVARVASASLLANAQQRVELCAPVRFGDRSIGVLRLFTSGGSTFDLQDLDLLNILARHAGSALETARLFRAQDVERQRAEAAADLARAVLRADGLDHGAAKLLHVLDGVAPTSGKALGIARGRDGCIEYVSVSGSLDALIGHRPTGSISNNFTSPDGKPFDVRHVRDVAESARARRIPDEWAFIVPLVARDRILGVLVASMPLGTTLDHTTRSTLERLSASLALACDALLLDEEEQFSRERERMLATALTTMDQAVFILDRQTVRYANPAATREYGWPLAELSGMTWNHIVSGGDSTDGKLPAVPETNATASPPSTGSRDTGLMGGEAMHRRRDGSEFPAAVTRNCITAADGNVVGHVISVRNVSAEHEIAAGMRHAEKMLALGDLVAGVAHEINNPLAGISAFAQLLLEEQMTADQRESVKLIKRESDRAATVIRDLLLFARKDSATVGPVDINALLEQTVRLRTYQLRNANIEITLLLDPSSPHILGDSQKLQQVLLNVIVNAEHAMSGRAHARLLLRTVRHGDRVVIDATDNGIGMSPAQSRRIFEPFYTTKPTGLGTGLGLSVSYGIVQAHNGRIEARSEPGVGTTISIDLPGAPHPGLFATASNHNAAV